MGRLNKSKSFNRRGRKGKTQSSQRAEFMCLSFAVYATSLRSLRDRLVLLQQVQQFAVELMSEPFCVFYISTA
jgi:hypothetical protein